MAGKISELTPTTTPTGLIEILQGGSNPSLDLAYLKSPHVILEYQKAANTAGGTFTSGADRTRDLNTEVYDPLGLCSISSNQFTLQAGTYYIEWSAPAITCGAHQSWLYNVTDAATAKRGTSEYSDPSFPVQNRSCGSAVVTIAGAKAFEIRHRCAATASGNGFGVQSNLAGGEVYTRVEITKLA